MTSLELNKAQGLDAAQIRAHMEKLGYRRRPCREFPICKSLGNHTHHGSEDRDLAVPDAWSKALPHRRLMVELTLSLLAALAGISVQELLQEINPRMLTRPSHSALASHEGAWLARDQFGNPRVGWWQRRTTEAPWTFYVLGRGHLSLTRVAGWSFWPAGANLDKCRWPTDENGVML